MMALNEGDSLEDFVGPLGCPSELCQEDNLEETKKKHIVFIAGGLGTAPVYPQVKWLKEHGVDADVIMGFRNKDILFFEDEMKAVAKNPMFVQMMAHTASTATAASSFRHLLMPAIHMTAV